MGPEGGGDGRNAVGDAGAVLADHYTVAAAYSGVAVCHVGGALFMHHRDEANASGGKNVHGVHESRAHDAEGGVNAVCHHSFNECFAGGHFGHGFLRG